MTRVLLAALMTGLVGWPQVPAAPEHFGRGFIAAADGEATITVVASCGRCDWGQTGREAAVLRVSLDGRYSQHIVLARGAAPAEYRITLGPVAKGQHRVDFDRDPDLSASGAGPVTVDLLRSNDSIAFPGSDDFTAQAMAPIVYARANTVGRFTDLPLVMWYETAPTARGRTYRYSVIFSNEDGGTQTDRLMATWGRTTDVEFIYGVEVDEAGRVLAEEFQGPGHEVPAFTGSHEGRHPLLWVSTDNNMVSESGSTVIRYAPAPVRFDLADKAREAVMDANPWTYAIAAAEMRREGKVADDPPTGINKIPDPRRFVHVEACGTVGNAALALSIGTPSGSVPLQPDREPRSGRRADGDLAWTSSDRGLPQYRIVRDGCFTIATPLPAGTRPSDIRAIRAHAFERPPARGAAPSPANPITLTRINKVFMLDGHDLPTPSILSWEGSQTIRVGEPFEVKVQ